MVRYAEPRTVRRARRRKAEREKQEVRAVRKAQAAERRAEAERNARPLDDRITDALGNRSRVTRTR